MHTTPCTACRPLNRTLVALRITQPQMVVGLVVAAQHVAACYLFIHRLHWGYLGAAAAAVWSTLLSLVLTVAWVAVAGMGELVWGRPSREALSGWRTFAGLAYASAGKAGGGAAAAGGTAVGAVEQPLLLPP